MQLRSDVSLAAYTTLRVGGKAKFFRECSTEGDLLAMVAEARREHLPLAIIGGGSNTLASDAGFDGLVLKIAIGGIVFREEGDAVFVEVGAGVSWDELVQEATTRGLWGVENLAGIPGTVGGAVVQNIGAYGAELKNVFAYADAVDLATGAQSCVDASIADFDYRTSIFKRKENLVITRATLRVSHAANPTLSYKDLRAAHDRGEALTTPVEIARTVRAIRADKFPDLTKEGTAGSFFKNPVIARELADSLARRYPALPQFPSGRDVKVSLAWILDHVLGLKGFSIGGARLFEKQPLVIVTSSGATAQAVVALADTVVERVRATTDISIEREVENLRARHF